MKKSIRLQKKKENREENENENGEKGMKKISQLSYTLPIAV